MRTRDHARQWLRLAAVIVGFGQFWSGKYLIYADGVSYLQIADHYATGKWDLAINAYWSPMLSWVMALAEVVFRRTSPAGALLLHIVNLVAYLVSLIAFEFFFSQLTEFVQERRGTSFITASGQAVWSILGYSAFIWGATGLIAIYSPTPDVLLTAFVYLIFGLLLKIASGHGSGLVFAAFGLTIALGYFTKEGMLALAPVFFITAACLIKPRRLAFRRIGVAIAVFCIALAPWLAALHHAKGYWTVGEAGRLNYAWEVDGVTPFVHWQGEPGLFGMPEHPSRKLLDAPAVYEFGDPLPVAYPPWYDPSYWYAGLSPHFIFSRQMNALGVNGIRALFFLILVPGLLPLLAIAGWRRELKRQAVRSTFFLTVPAAMATGLYSLVYVEARYVAPFLTILGLTLAAHLYRPEDRSRWPRAGVLAAVLLTCGYFCLPTTAFGLFTFLRDAVNRNAMFPDTTAALAEEIRQFGAMPGDRIGYIGGGAINADWARLDQLRIVAEVAVRIIHVNDLWHTVERDQSETDTFWKSGSARQDLVYSLFRKAGAKFAVAEGTPEWANTEGWHRLKATSPKPVGTPFIYVRRLEGTGIAAP